VQFNPSPRRIEYTNEQPKLTISKEGAQKIRGVAGCGKTQILAQRAVNAFHRTGKSQRVLILTYNLTLINYIRNRINELRREYSMDDFYITNYHDFISTEMNKLGLEFDFPEEFEEYTAKQKAAFFARYYQNTSLFEEVKYQIVKYPVVLVDEVQDYKYEWMELIRKYFLAENGEYVLFGDEKQNIYNNELDEKAPKTNVRGRWHYLTNTFRLSEATIRRKYRQRQQRYLLKLAKELNYQVQPLI
jgi:superfamily I DNA and RNA helicase